MAHGDDVLASAFERRSQIFEGRPRRKALVGLGIDPEVSGQLFAGLARAEERAREDDVRLHVLVSQALSERARLLAALGRQLPQLVGLARRGLRMADQVQAHGGENNGVATFRYVVCDVFTDRALAGNQLAVFTDAREIPEDVLQPLAREINFSETVFVLPSDEGHARIRIFTPTTELPFAGHPILGSAFVLGGSEDEVAALRPDLTRLGKLDEVLGFNCIAGSGSHWKTRMFIPGGGISEDPATGSAAGPLAVHLARYGRIAFGEEIEISQGAEIGRPSTLYARVEGSADRIERVQVGGSAVTVAHGEFRL